MLSSLSYCVLQPRNITLLQSNPTSTEKNRLLKIMLVISAFLSIIFLDQTGVSVILASIQRQLALSNSAISWIMNAYLLALSAFLLFFARLSDAFGIKTIFCLGITIFMLASIGCATADSATGLIASRALQGVGASMGYATYLLILHHQIAAKDRGRVLGTSAAFAALFLALGPLIGGFFSAIISWRYLFWLNVPICLACLYFIATACSKDQLKSQSWLQDPLGLLFYLIALISLVVFLMEGPTFGWRSPFVMALFVAAVLFFIVFVKYEQTHPHPFVEIDLYKNKTFFASILILFGNYACVTSIVFWALWLQQVLAYSPLLAGVALLPAGVPYIFTAKMAGVMYDQRGARPPLLIGSILFLVGFIAMALAALSLHFVWFMLSMILVGLGWGFVRPSAILSGLNSVPVEHKSMATGLISTMRQLGAAVGFALTYAVISTYQHFLLVNILTQHRLSITIEQLNRLITHSAANPALVKLLPAVKMAHTAAFALGLAVLSLLALLNLVLVLKYIAHKNQRRACSS